MTIIILQLLIVVPLRFKFKNIICLIYFKNEFIVYIYMILRL